MQVQIQTACPYTWPGHARASLMNVRPNRVSARRKKRRILRWWRVGEGNRLVAIVRGDFASIGDELETAQGTS